MKIHIPWNWILLVPNPCCLVIEAVIFSKIDNALNLDD